MALWSFGNPFHLIHDAAKAHIGVADTKDILEDLCHQDSDFCSPLYGGWPRHAGQKRPVLPDIESRSKRFHFDQNERLSFAGARYR